MKKIMSLSILTVVGVLSAAIATAQIKAQDVEHIKVYYEKGMYGGWPANNGIWIWGNEILVGFAKGFYKDLGPEYHNMDREKPELHLMARSLDGGKGWTIEDPGTAGMVPDGIFMAVKRTDLPQQASKVLPEPINFAHPDFALTARTNDIDDGTSRYWYSYDRGHQWDGPFELPDFGTKGTAARTDYIVENENECSMFITVSKENGKEGRPVYIRTLDGGKTWKLVSWIGPEPEGFSIMPASVRLSKNELVVLLRRREKNQRFIAAYSSKDNGQTWTHLANPVEDTGIGNPPALVKMNDGLICLIYGYRADLGSITAKTKTSDIRAKLSSDGGQTWSEDYILRSDGSGQDIGYPRVVQRPNGKIVALYYFMDNETGPERYIAASIWSPPAK